MKKTEIVRKLQSFMNEEFSQYFNEKDVSNIVTFLEKQGMLPPDWSNKAKTKFDSEGHNLWESEAEEKFQAFTWEPENG